jgi:hypothetical protein
VNPAAPDRGRHICLAWESVARIALTLAPGDPILVRSPRLPSPPASNQDAMPAVLSGIDRGDSRPTTSSGTQRARHRCSEDDCCTLQGMVCVRSGQAGPGLWFLTGVSAEAPGSRAAVKKFRSLKVFSVWAVLEAGGAGTYTQRAIPGSEPSPFSLHLPGISSAPQSERLAPARSADAPNAVLPRKALAAQAGRGGSTGGDRSPRSGGPGGGSPREGEAFAFGLTSC